VEERRGRWLSTMRNNSRGNRELGQQIVKKEFATFQISQTQCATALWGSDKINVYLNTIFACSI
jgi:hypothetical protein